MTRRTWWPTADPAVERRVALVVVLVFVLAGTAWILATDLLLYAITRNPVVVARVETAKGWAFVALTAVLLYAVVRRSAAQLAKANRTMSAVVESIGDGVLLLGSDRTIAHANPAAIRMLRAANLEGVRGMDAAEFSRRFHVSYPDGHLVPPDQFVSQRVFDEAGPMHYKALLHPPGGSEVVILCTAAPVRSDVEESADLVVSVMHDITAADQLDHLRDELFTAAAHAIRTPVAVIKGTSQVLATGVPPHLHSSTAMIERQCGRIERLVDNIFVLSRIRSGTLQLYPAEVELAPVVEDVVREAARLSHRHDIRVQLDARPSVRADRERLVMVVRNALDAATRASAPGGSVTVRLERRGADAEIVVFFQPQSSLEAAGDGSQGATDFDDLGISRYVTRTIVEAHLGTLTEQADDVGTTVRIRLPTLLEDAV